MKAWIVFCWVAAVCLSVRADFFKSDRDCGASWAADKVYPAGRIFPFGGFSPPAGMNFHNFGFSLAGPVYGGHDAMKNFIDTAAAQGVPAIWQLTVEYKGRPLSIKELERIYAAKEPVDWAVLQRNIDDAVGIALKQGQDRFAWWAVTPEELRHWKPVEMEYLRRVCESIRRQDSLKRPIWMYIPGHYGLASLKHYTPYLDILMQGYYPHAGRTPRVWCRYWAENILGAAAGANRQLLVGVVPEMYIEPAPEDYDKINGWVRHDVYMPLICGVRAVVVFSLGRRSGFEAHNQYLGAYRKVARSLTRPGGFGEVLLFGEKQSDLKWTMVNGPATVPYMKRNKDGSTVVEKEYPTLAWNDLKHSTGRYCFVGSSSESPVRARLSGLPASARVVDAETGRELGVGDGCEFEFAPYEIKILKMEPIQAGR